jgi:hypothetical protein
VRRALPLLLLFAVPIFAADNVYDSPSGHQCLVEVLRKSGWGLGGPFERAAFITEQLDGSLGCQEWPSVHEYRTEKFFGAIPAQAIAIVHTHPVQFPKPSKQDDAEATRLGIPIYTLTIRGVYKSVPGQDHVVMIADRQSWIRETPSLKPPLRADKLAVDVKSDGLSNK